MLERFNVCRDHAPLNHSGQDSKNNLQFMNQTSVTLK